MDVTVYATSTCPYCEMLEEYLRDKNVKFTKKLVDEDQAAQKEMMDRSQGFLGVPFVTIVNPEGKMQFVVGFDKAKISSILGL